MKEYILFLQGTYKKGEFDYYRQLALSKIKIAVDGGYVFFKNTGITPDLIIGDMDSIRNFPKNLPETVKIIRFPQNKDKTDSHLAIEYCIAERADVIDIVMPTIGEIDHWLGNVMLITANNILKWVQNGGKIRFINYDYELFLVKYENIIFCDNVDDLVSVIPFSKKIVLSCSGTAYPVKNLKISRGHSLPLRNRITAKKAVFTIDGEALVYHHFSR